MVIVITLPHFTPNEADAIIAQFEQRGIDYLHLRKPQATEAEVEQLLQQIPPQYYPRITIHDFQSLAVKYGLGGIHLTGRHPQVEVEGWEGRVSASCHSIEELARCREQGVPACSFAAEEAKHETSSRPFSYLSLSPIFDSISKQGYLSAFTHAQLATAHAQGIIDHRVLALGGVTFDRLPEVQQMGFGGGMILGDAWRNVLP